MKVWTKLVSVWDAEKGQYVTDEAASEWHEYEGPVAEMKSSGSKAAKREAARQRAEEAARQKRIQLGMAEIDKVFSGFGDDFYNQRRAAYLDYAKPQLEDQFGEQNRNLIFALARGGNLESSLAAERKAKLLGERDQRIADIGNEAQNLVNATRQSIEGSRSDLTNQLFATGDNQLASQNAMRQAAALSARPGFSPIGQLFNDAAGGIGAYAGGRRYGQIQDQINQFDKRNNNLFGGGSMTVGR